MTDLLYEMAILKKSNLRFPLLYLTFLGSTFLTISEEPAIVQLNKQTQSYESIAVNPDIKYNQVELSNAESNKELPKRDNNQSEKEPIFADLIKPKLLFKKPTLEDKLSLHLNI